MHKKLWGYSISLLIVVAMIMCVDASRIIEGDKTHEGQSLSFPISTTLYEKNNGYFFMGSGKKLDEKVASFALAVGKPPMAQNQSQELSPIITSTIATINGSEVKKNPLLGAQIDHLALFIFHPSLPHLVAVSHDEPGTIYITQSSLFHEVKHMELLSMALHDAQHKPTGGILGLATNAPDLRSTSNSTQISLQPEMTVFAAVKNEAGVFGQEGSGIAGAAIEQNSDSKKFALRALATAPLDVTSEVVRIGNPLAAMYDHVSMHSMLMNVNGEPWNQIYAGLQVTGGAHKTDGAHGLIMWNGVQQDSIQTATLCKLAPDTAITTDSIIAARGSSAQVNIYHIASMVTTTHLRYLIVVGGVAPHGSARTVFALPLVTTLGVLANVHANVLELREKSYPEYLVSRSLPPAQYPGDLYTSSDIPACVGGNGTLSGDITRLVVSGDAVFVTIVDYPGIFHSQALYDAWGKIKGWTDWQRTGGVHDILSDCAFDDRSGIFWSLITTDTSTTVKRATWEKGTRGIAGLFNKLFIAEQGGIQGLFDFPKITSSFNQNDNPLSIMVATGNKQVVIAQSGTLKDGIFGPLNDMQEGFVSKNGNLQNFAPGVPWLLMTGGALDELGPIVAASIVHNNTYGWFAVAGAHGVAVLAKPDGTGWPLNSGLQSGFEGLTADMRWVKIGSWRAVRKLIFHTDAMHQQHELYILTQTSLERIPISPQLFTGENGLHATILAQAGALPGGNHAFFSDALISKNVGLLATSSGLLRAGNGSRIAIAHNAAEVGWVPVVFPEGTKPSARLLSISPNGIEQDFAQIAPAISGNVYVLNTCVGSEQAHVYRLNIDYAEEIDDTTVSLLPDMLLQDKNSCFLNFGYYRNFIATDGAICAASRSKFVSKNKELEGPSFLEIIHPVWKRGALANILRKPMVKDAIRVVQDQNSRSIGRMMKESVTGSWLVPGDFGIYINE